MQNIGEGANSRRKFELRCRFRGVKTNVNLDSYCIFGRPIWCAVRRIRKSYLFCTASVLTHFPPIICQGESPHPTKRERTTHGIPRPRRLVAFLAPQNPPPPPRVIKVAVTRIRFPFTANARENGECHLPVTIEGLMTPEA